MVELPRVEPVLLIAAGPDEIFDWEYDEDWMRPEETLFFWSGMNQQEGEYCEIDMGEPWRPLRFGSIRHMGGDYRFVPAEVAPTMTAEELEQILSRIRLSQRLYPDGPGSRR